MKTYKFQTNIMCASCIAKVTPVLNKMVGENNWEVKTNEPTKILTINNSEIPSSEVIQALQEIGYKAIPLQD